MSGDMAQFLRDLFKHNLSDIKQGMVCLIESFDGERMRADVKPLMKIKGDTKEEDLPILPDIPVCLINGGADYMRPDYSKGDMVWVTFATNDIDNSLEGSTRTESGKLFDLANASVVCGVAEEGWSHPTEFSKPGLLMGRKDGSAYIQFTSGKITMYFGSNKVEFDNAGVKATVAGQFYTLKNHIHAGPGVPPTPNT